MKKNLGAAALLLVLLIYGGCSGNPPQIDEMEWRILLRDDGVNRYEELNLFLRISDPDGNTDPALVTVSVGDTGYLWRCERDLWINGEDEWWGLPAMIPESGSRLPDGLYSVRLEDLAGSSAELTFRPSKGRMNPNDVSWPTAEESNGLLMLPEEHSKGILMLRDADGMVLESLAADDGTVLNREGVDSWELWIPDPAGGTSGFILGPYFLVPIESQ